MCCDLKVLRTKPCWQSYVTEAPEVDSWLRADVPFMQYHLGCSLLLGTWMLNWDTCFYYTSMDLNDVQILHPAVLICVPEGHPHSLLHSQNSLTCLPSSAHFCHPSTLWSILRPPLMMTTTKARTARKMHCLLVVLSWLRVCTSHRILLSEGCAVSSIIFEHL